MRTWNEILSAAAGTIVLNNDKKYEGSVAAIHVIGDALFSTITDAKGNEMDSYITDPEAVVKAGAMITPFDKQNEFVSIELISGSVVLVL